MDWMNKKQIMCVISEWKRKKGVSGYMPYKYFSGLTSEKNVVRRAEEILRGSRTEAHDSTAYSRSAFKTDRKVTPRTSTYTMKFRRKYPQATSLRAKSEATGVPLDVLKRVYDKGVAAWRTGHRVGVSSPERWGYARVHSFLMLGCAAMSADSGLLKEAAGRMTPRRRDRWLGQPIECSKAKLTSPYYAKFDVPGWMASKSSRSQKAVK